MAMTREDRVASQKKQERLQIKAGAPSVAELKESVPVLRSTTEGIVEYVKHSNKLFKKILNEANFIPLHAGEIDELKALLVVIPMGAIADLNQNISASYVEAEVQAISDKVDALLAALRTAKLLSS